MTQEQILQEVRKHLASINGTEAEVLASAIRMAAESLGIDRADVADAYWAHELNLGAG